MGKGRESDRTVQDGVCPAESPLESSDSILRFFLMLTIFFVFARPQTSLVSLYFYFLHPK